MKIEVDFIASGPENSMSINLDDETVVELFEDAFYGYCPVCKGMAINEDEVICCECLRKAKSYHRRRSCCMDKEDNIEA